MSGGCRAPGLENPGEKRATTAWLLLWLWGLPVVVLTGSWMLLGERLTAAYHDVATGRPTALLVARLGTALLLVAVSGTHLLLIGRGGRGRARTLSAAAQIALLVPYLAGAVLLMSGQAGAHIFV